AVKLLPPTAKPRLHSGSRQELRQSWCSLVETYSDSHLTQPSDKMIALAGLASQFRDIAGDIYLAGLWKADLVKPLCCRYDSSSDDHRKMYRSRTLHYYAPTWSWASFD